MYLRPPATAAAVENPNRENDR